MHTAAELDRMLDEAARWCSRVRIGVFVATPIVLLARAPETRWMLLDRGLWDAAIVFELAFYAVLAAWLWLDWRVARLEDAAARARTVARIAHLPNPRVEILGESDRRECRADSSTELDRTRRGRTR